MIYFIKAERSGDIKIGKANDPSSRLAQLSTGSPEPLTLLGTIEGDYDVERKLHERFAAHRSHGEWFRPHDELLAEIRRMLAPPTPVLNFYGLEIHGVYLAGKITGDNWRDEIAPGWSDYGKDSTNCGGTCEDGDWSDVKCFCEAGPYEIRVTGPVWVDVTGGHGGPGGWPHAQGSWEREQDFLGRPIPDKVNREQCRKTVCSVRTAIDSADIVFAWIDSLDCYGTICELGVASGLGVPIILFTPPNFDASEIWLPLTLAHFRGVASSPGNGWSRFIDFAEGVEGARRTAAFFKELDGDPSP